MVSAFTARPIIELKPRDKSKIESVLAHGKADEDDDVTILILTN